MDGVSQFLIINLDGCIDGWTQLERKRSPTGITSDFSLYASALKIFINMNCFVIRTTFSKKGIIYFTNFSYKKKFKNIYASTDNNYKNPNVVVTNITTTICNMDYFSCPVPLPSLPISNIYRHSATSSFRLLSSAYHLLCSPLS